MGALRRRARSPGRHHAAGRAGCRVMYVSNRDLSAGSNENAGTGTSGREPLFLPLGAAGRFVSPKKARQAWAAGVIPRRPAQLRRCTWHSWAARRSALCVFIGEQASALGGCRAARSFWVAGFQRFPAARGPVVQCPQEPRSCVRSVSYWPMGRLTPCSGDAEPCRRPARQCGVAGGVRGAHY
jgi:hypothetical protein